MSKFGEGALNLAKQALLIRHDWPSFHATVNKQTLIARGTLSPNGLAGDYVVRIEYRRGKSPSVFVERPALKRRAQNPDEPIPHTYDSRTPGKERPCVFFPYDDWNPTKVIAKTVIPWLMCWLVDYELWHGTGEWMGGGRHPGR